MSGPSDVDVFFFFMRNLGTKDVEYFDSYGFDYDDLRLLLSRQTNFTGYLKQHTEKGGKIHSNEIELQCLEGDQYEEYAVKFILDGLPMKRGVVNKKWRVCRGGCDVWGE